MAALLNRAHREHRELLGLLSRADVAWAAREGASDSAARRTTLPALLRNCEARLTAHLAEEERMVYPLLGAHLSRETGALDVALDEHATLRNLACFLRQRHAAFERGEFDAEAAIAALLRDLVDLWRAHSYRVDRVIGPLLRQLGKG